MTCKGEQVARNTPVSSAQANKNLVLTNLKYKSLVDSFLERNTQVLLLLLLEIIKTRDESVGFFSRC
uniref:Uncharacterized protein n=1 Tax=Glossina austeni TaxID=7395 RepID=A0A1A9UN19_GLOAU